MLLVLCDLPLAGGRSSAARDTGQLGGELPLPLAGARPRLPARGEGGAGAQLGGWRRGVVGGGQLVLGLLDLGALGILRHGQLAKDIGFNEQELLDSHRKTARRLPEQAA